MKKLTGFELKMIAAVAMFLDHAGALFFPQVQFLRVIGRLAFPLFCFLSVEGFLHTRNVYRYFGNLFLCACISEIIFDLTFYDAFILNRNNAVFTLAGGVLSLIFIRRFDMLTGCVFSLVCGYFLQVAGVDYGFYGTLLIVMMYMAERYCTETKEGMFLSWGAIALFMILYQRNLQAFGAFSILLIALYNGKRGYASGWAKHFFYVFYPLHLLILMVIKVAVV